MKKGFIAGIIGVVLLSGAGIYYLLGGFNEIEFSLEKRQDIALLGLTYRGIPEGEALGETFRQVHQLISKYPEARLHTLYEIEPAGKRDTLAVFVGIENSDSITSRDGLEEKTIPCSRVIVANIEAHRLVMPVPEVVKKKIEAYAEEMGLVTQGVYVDVIINERHVRVIAPIEG